MVAEFYIIPDSFANNPQFSREQIESKIKSLAIDFREIKKYKDSNRLFVHSDIYNVEFIEGLTLGYILFDPQRAKQHIDRDVFNALNKIIIESQSTTHTSQEVIEVLLPEHSDEICHGLIAFQKVDGVDESFQLIYGIDGWYIFRRYFLGLYPKNGIYFINECTKYFPKIFFHEQNKQSISRILDNCPKKIIYHLAAFNDKFRESQLPQFNRTQVLEHFSRNTDLDAIASLEGDAGRKDALSFSFINKDNQSEQVCCEPHMKLCYNDNYPGDNSYSNDRRIYFHEGKANIQNGKLLVGHIGVHL